MKKYFLLFLFSILLLSCSKGGKVTINGKVTNGSPLERLEIIDASGIATLPLANFGVDAKEISQKPKKFLEMEFMLLLMAGTQVFFI